MLLAFIPFVLIAMLYVVGSAERRAANPNDKLLPPVAEMADTSRRLAFEPDRRTGEVVLWVDTAASLRRLAIGLGLATLAGLCFGLALGLVPTVDASLGTLVAVLSMIPPMAVLPILFIVFGLGELSKVVLIVFGVTPCLIRDLALKVTSLPREQMVKAQSLGASTWQVAIRVVLPQIMPRLIESLRLQATAPVVLGEVGAAFVGGGLQAGARLVDAPSRLSAFLGCHCSQALVEGGERRALAHEIVLGGAQLVEGGSSAQPLEAVRGDDLELLSQHLTERAVPRSCRSSRVR